MYHLPSQPLVFKAFFSSVFIVSYLSALTMSCLEMQIGINFSSIEYKKNPSQTLSPFPLLPTSLNPSFQSPEPILGRPFLPNCNALSIAFIQWLYMLSSTSPSKYISYLSSSLFSKFFPIRYFVVISKMLLSPVKSIYSKVAYGSHNKSSENLVLIPLLVSSCHQCSTSPS